MSFGLGRAVDCTAPEPKELYLCSRAHNISGSDDCHAAHLANPHPSFCGAGTLPRRISDYHDQSPSPRLSSILRTIIS